MSFAPSVRRDQDRRAHQGRAARAEEHLRADDDRRTEIVAAEEELELEDLIAEEDMVIAISRSGYIKRLPVTSSASSAAAASA